METGFNMTTFFKALNALAWGALRTTFDYPRLTRLGYIHGATVMYIGHWAHDRSWDATFPTEADWNFMISTVSCPHAYIISQMV